MPRISRALLACVFVPLSAMAAPQTYVMDPMHTFPNFTVSYLGMTTLHGRFEKTAGKIVLDQAGKTGSLEARITTASVTTGDAKHADGTRSRDEHLRTPDFLNSSEFPEMVYKSTKFNFNNDALESVEGNLTLLGVTKPVKLNVVAFKCGPHPFNKKPVCGADAEGSFKRTDFGMKFGVPAISDDVKLSFSVLAYQE